MVLTPAQLQSYYDRFGSKQDSQAFYEDVALADLVAHAGFDQARAVFEFGCGTGRFASRLLEQHLSASATYVGIDLSATMISISRQRLSRFGARASVEPAAGSISFPLPEHSVDRVVSTYVLDLLAENDIRQYFGEAQRVLTADGKLCIISLTRGTTLLSRLVSGLWSMVFRIHARLVGGCRPVRLEVLLDRQHWTIDYRNVVTPFAIPSEVIVATKTNGLP